MKRAGLFFCIFFSLSMVKAMFAKSLSPQEQLQLAQRNQQAQQILQQLFDVPRSDFSADNADFGMRSVALQTVAQKNHQQIFESSTVYYEPIIEAEQSSVFQLKRIFEDKNKLQEQSLSQVDNASVGCDQANTYIKIATALIYCGYKGYQFFKKDKINYRLQNDVLDVPYKKMVYFYTQAIDKLFEGAQQKDDIGLQIKSLILLCRIPVPQRYKKSFQKGLDIVYETCFDVQGNFNNIGDFEDIKLIFKDYCRKAPQSWQEIAKISDWWCKKKPTEPVATKYSTDTLTEHNQQLLSMIESDKFTDLRYLKNMVIKNGSPVAQKIYDYHLQNFFKDSVNEFGIWKRANLDPWWKNRSWQEKQSEFGNKQLNEILMMRDQRVQQLLCWILRRYDNHNIVAEQINDTVILDAFYGAFTTDESIFDNHDDQDLLRKIFISCITYLVEHKHSFENSLMFTQNGILKKYEFHPLVFKDDLIYDADLQVYINCALVLQSDFFDEQTRSLAIYLGDYAKMAQFCDDEIQKIINHQCATQIFKILSH